MNDVTHPTKAQVQAYLQQRHRERSAPPTMEEIRRQLGWHLLRQQRQSS